MKKQDFETYHKRFWDFEILTKFSETNVFRGTIRHPYYRIQDIIENIQFMLRIPKAMPIVSLILGCYAKESKVHQKYQLCRPCA